MELTNRARLVATAAALVVAGCVLSSDGDAAPASAESVPAGGAAPAALDGVYRAEVLGSRGRFNGEPYPSRDSTRWYAIRSSCSAAGCTARATQVDDDQAMAPLRGRTFDVSFQRGRWIGAPVADTSPCLADPDRNIALSVAWRLDPHPDGSLTGSRSLTESRDGTSPCAGSGGVYEVPVVLIPVGSRPR
ncbi:MAG: serine/threonine protein kinase, bacterial [Mycobacterium sp.]|nr:serine/threonine protein kinase, bacterial [Mycobacterium sp.]